MKIITVKVQADHLQTLSRTRKPLLAVAELIWNGLDADATEVRVFFELNVMGGLESIRVADNGHGLSYNEAVPAFENLGGSWKRDEAKTKTEQRLLHGRLGKGRFRAFSIGESVRWRTRFSEDGQTLEYSISGTRSELGRFEIGDPGKPAQEQTGTEVEISGIQKNFPSLRGDSAIQEITEHFALYLREYPDVTIIYDGERIDPAIVEESVTDYTLEPLKLEDDQLVSATLTIIEWKVATERALYLCDKDGFTLAEIPPGIQAVGFNFTGYLKSDYLRELEQDGALILEDLHPHLKKLLDSAKEQMREHFRARAAGLAVELVQQWKDDRVYPYEGEPENILEATERQVFDVLALNLNSYLPDFERSDSRNKRLALRLLKHALESDPSAVQLILQDVLDLPSEKQEELAELLKRTSLAAIINASKIVADRLDFLEGLEILVFNQSQRANFWKEASCIVFSWTIHGCSARSSISASMTNHLLKCSDST